MRSKGFLLLLFLSVKMSLSAQQKLISAIDSNAMKAHYFAGLKEKMNENYPKAVENFHKVLAIDANSAAAHYEIATLHFRQNKLKESEAAIKQATTLDANNVWYWKLLAELYKRKGDMDEIVPVFDHLIRLAPDNDGYYFDRCNALFLGGKADDALKGYEELERKFGSSAALNQAKQRISMGKGNGMNKQEVSKLISESEDVKSLLFAAGLLLEKGQHADALSVLKKAKVIDSLAFEVDLAIADAYRGLRKYADVQAALKNAFARGEMPSTEKVKIVMVMLSGNNNQQHIVEAAELARIAAKAHPSEPRVMALYGDILYRQGNLEAALSQFKSVLDITDQIYQVWEQVLSIQISLGMHEQAVSTADEALSIYPNQAILYYYMALALQNNNKLGEALTHIKAALELDKGNSLFEEVMGDILYINGDKELALVTWKKAKAAGRETEQLNRKIHEKKYIK